MTNPELTDRILRQGRALVRAIEALGTIQPTGPFERALARLLMAAYKRGCVACAVLLTSIQSCNTLCACDQEEPPPLGALARTAKALRRYGLR
jgi:hypothetical protein